ncbi:NTP transferase domain-containing protein, partial [Candidatus Roizmanbacteria bacterium]|nr:NTP transferase domain-containing protein [Candidatus Roizmanbacteria bacterium]
VLAGGLGTRLYPLTHVTNKHLLPIYDKPMIYYPINTLVRSGITEIMIVVGGPHAGHFISLLKNVKELGISHLEYAYQEKEGGIAQALYLAKDFSDGDNLTVILGDNTTDADISPEVKKFQKGAWIFLKEVQDPSRFGIALFDKTNKSTIVKIVEKPQESSSNLAVTGLYIYDNRVFSYIEQCKPSGRNELEISDVNNLYIKNNSFNYSILNGYWSDAGTFDSLYAANQYWARKKQTP